MHVAVMDIGALRVGVGSHDILAETAETAAGIVALADLIEIVKTVVLAGLVELADTAASLGFAVFVDIDVLGIVGFADTVAQNSHVVVAEIAA